MATGPNLSSKPFVHPTWALLAKRRDFQKQRSENKQSIRTEEIILLHLHIGNLGIRVLFEAAEDLVVGL